MTFEKPRAASLVGRQAEDCQRSREPPDRVPRRTVGWLCFGTDGDRYPRAFLIAPSSIPLMAITLDGDK
jgi:hypothetical protein